MKTALAGFLSGSITLGALAASSQAFVPPVVTDLAIVEFEDTGAVTEDIPFDVPEGTRSAMLHCGGYGDAALGMVQRLSDPTGKAVWDAEAGTSAGFRADASDDGLTMLLPLTPDAPLVPGRWAATVLVGPHKLPSMRCQLLTSTAPEAAHPVLRLEVSLVGFPDGYAAAFGKASYVRQLMRAVRRDFASSDVHVEFTFRDFVEAEEDRWAIIDIKDDDMGEFNGLLRLAKPADPRAIPVFFVKEIANHSAGGATILGMSAGPPGAAGLGGTSKAGLIVTAMDIEHSPDEVARILAHELGHFLGLFHTTEKKGDVADLVPDTPVCASDADHNGVLNSFECKKQGFENVMWWTMGKARSKFTLDQEWVLHHHPLVQP